MESYIDLYSLYQEFQIKCSSDYGYSWYKFIITCFVKPIDALPLQIGFITYGYAHFGGLHTVLILIAIVIVSSTAQFLDHNKGYKVKASHLQDLYRPI
jgi:hypothetical protein